MADIDRMKKLFPEVVQAYEAEQHTLKVSEEYMRRVWDFLGYAAWNGTDNVFMLGVKLFV